jgi:carboxylesterase type B
MSAVNSLLDKYSRGLYGNKEGVTLLMVTPQLPDGNEGLPVLMWIHGGGHRRGSASQYGVRHLVKKKTVVVTIQYRLGSLGESY